MDNASITDQAAKEADNANSLPFFIDANWYSYNGIKINGTESSLRCSNSITSINVLMTEPHSGSEYSLSHRWGRGYNGVVYDKTTYIYIEVDAPTGVSLSDLPTRMLVGDEVDLKPKLLGTFTNFSGKGYFKYSYSTSDETVITLSSGKIKANKKGIATVDVEVYAKNSNYSGSYYIGKSSVEIEVVENLDPTGISLSDESLVLNVGNSHVLSALTEPEDARTAITWKSSDEAVATVENGCVSAVKRGSCIIEASTDNGFVAKCKVKVLGEEDYRGTLDIGSVSRQWGVKREVVKSSQSSDYYLNQENSTNLIYSTYVDDDTKIFISYKFDSDDKLCASAMSIPLNSSTQEFSDSFFAQFDSESEIIEGMEVKKEGNEIISIDNSTASNGGWLLTIGFSYYEPLVERDDCVDLGLSVRWAKNNLGATEPNGTGDFYAWSETHTKSEYWRENYKFCNNDANQYIFDYANPTANICGKKYDAATQVLGDGWRMPTLAEASELISYCTWEETLVGGITCYKVTGPNGNSIIIPRIGMKKQNKTNFEYQLKLATGECQSVSSEGCFVITTQYDRGVLKGAIGSEWKAWGYNIRPVFTK